MYIKQNEFLKHFYRVFFRQNRSRSGRRFLNIFRGSEMSGNQTIFCVFTFLYSQKLLRTDKNTPKTAYFSRGRLTAPEDIQFILFYVIFASKVIYFLAFLAGFFKAKIGREAAGVFFKAFFLKYFFVREADVFLKHFSKTF